MQSKEKDTDIPANEDWKLETLLNERQSSHSIEVESDDADLTKPNEGRDSCPPDEIMTKQKSYLMKPSNSSLVKLSKIRESGLFVRVFHPMKEGSLRGVVIMFIRMTLGVGVLTLPYYMKQFGGLLGVGILFLAAAVNYWTYAILTDLGNQTDIPDLLLLTKKYCHRYLHKLFKVTLLVDYISMVVFYMIMIYNVIMFLVAHLDLAPDSWYSNKKMLEFRQYCPALIIIRSSYCVLTILLMLPFIFRDSLGALQKISNYSLLVLCTMIIYICVEMGFFRKNLEKQPDFNVYYLAAKPDATWPACFFGVMLSYYSQTYFFSLRSELMHPTSRRLKKVSRLSMGYMFGMFLFLSIICYFCLGDVQTPDLIILRVPYPGKPKWSEYLFIGLVIVFLISSLITLPLYNIPVRDFMFCEFKFARSRTNYFLISIFAFLLGGIITIACPSVIGIWNFFSVTIYNYNGYMIPFILMIAFNKERGKGIAKYVIALVFCLLTFVGMVGYDIAALVTKNLDV